MRLISNRADLDLLLNALLPFAQQMLKKRGEFYPFALALTREGKVEAIATCTGDEKPPSQQVIDELVIALRAGAAECGYRAVGICSDVRVMPPNGGGKTDAVRVHLEHREGEAVAVYLPYRKKLLGRIEYRKLFGTAADPRVFPVGPCGGSEQ